VLIEFDKIKKKLIQAFRSVPGCKTCMFKHGINVTVIGDVVEFEIRRGYLYNMDRPSQHLVALREHGPQNGSGEPRASGVWTHLLQTLHCIEVRPTSQEQTEHEFFWVIGQAGAEPCMGCTLHLASKRRRARR